MTEAEVRQSYFEWLCDKVRANSEEDSYYILMKDLHNRQFIPIIDNDANRAYDGMELRERFVATELQYEDAWKMDMAAECTVLELLVALAMEMDYQLCTDDHDYAYKYFWEMLSNLGLSRFKDSTYAERRPSAMFQIDAILDDFLIRDYEPDGTGNIFPLKYPTEDQRGVEMWYQMQAYLGENYPM